MEANLSILTDDEIIHLFQQGNSKAFEELVWRYKNSLYQYILGMVKDTALADDLFQEVFLSFFTHKDSYQAQGKFKSWLFLTARNKVYNYVRDHKTAVSLDETDAQGKEVWHERLADGKKMPLENLTAQEVGQQLANTES